MPRPAKVYNCTITRTKSKNGVDTIYLVEHSRSGYSLKAVGMVEAETIARLLDLDHILGEFYKIDIEELYNCTPYVR